MPIAVQAGAALGETIASLLMERKMARNSTKKTPKGFAFGVKTAREQKRVLRLTRKPDVTVTRNPNPGLAPPVKATTNGAVPQPADHSLSDDVPKADAVTSELDAGKGGFESVPQNSETTGGTASGSAERPDGTGEISPGKNDPGPYNGAISPVAHYVSEIRGNWDRGVDAFMNISRLCAQANVQLTTAEKSALMDKLPFGEATFSKFAGIGSDRRLHTPEIQQLLPPHYTTVYEVSRLSSEQLSLAVANKVLHPDMKRAELQKWLRSLPKLVEDASQGAASDLSLPVAPTQDAVETGALSSAASQHEAHGNLEVQYELPSGLPAVEAGSEVSSPTVKRSVVPEEVASPPTAPVGNEDIPAFLDRRPFSPDNQRAFDDLTAAWDNASEVVRERFIAKVLRPNTSSRSAAN
jgi:hypothetical protein